MATSGTALGNHVIVSGSAYARIRIEWQLAGQNVGGNYSTINWQGYVDFVSCDAQLDNGHVNWNGGALYNNGGRVYNYAGNFSNHTIGMGSGSFNIGHDGAGNATLNLNGSIAVYASGTSSTNVNWGLPTIPRYASITAFYFGAVTDESITINWNASDNCDYVSWWSGEIDGGAHHDIPVSGSGTFSIARSGLLSETAYGFQVAVRRADSGLWTESGVISTTTLKQANFFGRLVP
jgi:hypothetical protein